MFELFLIGAVMFLIVTAGVIGAALVGVGLGAYLGYQVGGPCGACCGAFLAMALMGGLAPSADY